MTEKLRFEIFLETSCERRDARVLGRTAALCLCEAIGGQAAILWPGHIVLGGETIAEAGFVQREDGVLLSFEADPAHAPEDLAARVEAALRPLAADFPENREALLQRYCDHCQTLMKYVDIVYRGMPVYGFAFAVDKFGGLMVMTQQSRTVVTIYSGEAPFAADEPQQPDYPVMPRV